MNDEYRILIAATRGALKERVPDGYDLLVSTVKPFSALVSDDDHSFGDIGGIDVQQSGWVGLCRRRA